MSAESAEGAPPEDVRVRLVVRYDDFSNGSPDGLDRFLFETARSTGVPLCVAAVPFGTGPEDSRAADAPSDSERPLSEEKAALLAQAIADGSVELAQHGLDHEAVAHDPKGRPSECSGSEGEQVDRIRRGAELLERVVGARPRVFVPPWNRFDANTVSALETLGFEMLSAGREAPPASVGALRFAPATTPLAQLETQIRTARAARDRRVLVTLLHPYDFVETGSRWSRMDRAQWADLMAWIREQPDVEPLTFEGLSQAEPDLGLGRLGAYASYHTSALRHLVPSGWPGSIDRPLDWYPSTGEVGDLAGGRRLRATALWIGILALAGALGWVATTAVTAVAGSGGAAPATVRWGLLAASLAGGFRLWRSDRVYFKGLAVTLGCAAATVAAWLT